MPARSSITLERSLSRQWQHSAPTTHSRPAPASRIESFHAKASAADRDVRSVNSRQVAAPVQQRRIHARLYLPDIDSLLFFRLDANAAGFTVLLPVQPHFASIEQQQRY